MQKNRKINKRGSFPLLNIIIIVALMLVGCDNAKETMEDATKVVEESAEKAGEVVSETANDVMENVGETTNEIVDSVSGKNQDAVTSVKNEIMNESLLGIWEGKFDIRTAKLTILEQNGNDFSGKIVINFRTVINQDIKGTFNPKTNTITMEDQIRSRYKGTYKGKLSGDGKSFVGTFASIVDKTKYDFNLNKK